MSVSGTRLAPSPIACASRSSGPPGSPSYTTYTSVDMAAMVRTRGGRAAAWLVHSPGGNVRPVGFGVVLPGGQGGFYGSAPPPHAPATYDYNRRVVQLAEGLGLGFVISQARWRGFGGASGHNDVTLESITTTAALAECTTRIKLFCTIHTMAFHPAVAAKMI